MKKTKLVHGVGINDTLYQISEYEVVNGKQIQVWICPFYRIWRNMLERGYSSKLKEKNPTYKDVFVNEEWHRFSNFKRWMEQQKWQDKEGNKLQLDKDIIFECNKEYSKDKCIFVPKHINLFLTDRTNDRGEYPLGVCWDKHAGKFKASCNNGKGKPTHIGLFADPNEAHLAWKSYKHKIALQYADELEAEGYDSRLIEALRTRYL